VQNLAQNSYLQSVLLTSQIDDDHKVELIRHCVTIGQFIEETIRAINQDKFEDLFTGVRPTHVFELLHVGIEGVPHQV
jgi:hypothetical protein